MVGVVTVNHIVFLMPHESRAEHIIFHFEYKVNDSCDELSDKEIDAITIKHASHEMC